MSDLYEIEYYNSDDPEEHDDELSQQQKLFLSNRANEIYRQQLLFMQQHLASLRSLIQDKENIIENLMLRYEINLKKENNNDNANISTNDDIESEELRRKAEALAQRTVLENLELRDIINKLREENFNLRNEIYKLQDKINIQALQLYKLEKEKQRQRKDDSVNMRSDAYSHLTELIMQLDEPSINEIASLHDNTALVLRIKDLENDVGKMQEELAIFRERHKTSKLTRSKDIISKEDKMKIVYSELYKEEDYFPVMDEESKETEYDIAGELNLEKSKYKDLQCEYIKVREEVDKLKVLKVNVNIIRKLFGCSIKSLIPFQLNDNALMKYGMIFDGYYREVLGNINPKYTMIPTDVTKLISFYYPIFWTL